jgi:hypothetical protein
MLRNQIKNKTKNLFKGKNYEVSLLINLVLKIEIKKKLNP